ncbi:hypothetical protein MnTg04_00298 [bacterium MnTg04]|nr:hypothetical protein [Pseudomonadota bacterium]GBF30357.1 hypothetical protein MnTg04_00298 [bacterium MnTg04]
MIRKISLVLSLAIPMMACGSAEKEAAEEINDEAATAEEIFSEKTVFDPMVDAIEKAEAAKETIEKQKEQWDKILEEAENGDGET